VGIIKQNRKLLLLLIDVFVVAAVYLFSYFFFHYLSDGIAQPAVLFLLPMLLLLYAFSFWLFNVQKIIWRYAAVKQYMVCGAAALVAEGYFSLAAVLLHVELPAEFQALRISLTVGTLWFIRIGYLLILNRLRCKKQEKEEMASHTDQAKKRVLLVGAGAGCKLLLEELQRNSAAQYQPVCIVDDDIAKIGRIIEEVKVANNTMAIPELCQKFDIEVIIFCILNISNADKQRILELCLQTSCIVMKLPDVVSFLDTKQSALDALRNIDIEDLLGRETIRLKNSKVREFITGKVVMVTGGGGSIGSELCRQIAAEKPKKLIILDIYENNAYGIQQELWRKYGQTVNIEVAIASVRDAEKMNKLFCRERPQVIYHAAAHKHVPLMETSPEEAVKNNVEGTWNVARSASRYGAEKFVLISSDKAVNPTSVMGATKRCCEMIISCMNEISKTDFIAVRFGNVLGSNGSVIPLFQQQIAEGGPVTITHPDIIRYFMTIPEAVSLLLEAGSMGNSGEIFILDMGQPVKILDLAVKMIRLVGLVPGKDIELKFIGLRPGEKLYEELLLDEENIKETDNHQIFIGNAFHVDVASFLKSLDLLLQAAKNNDSAKCFSMLYDIIPNYTGSLAQSNLESLAYA